jgi:cytochrome c oxidase cbb3-type subunit IV
MSTTLNIIFTVLSLLVFLGVVFWAYNGHNKARFEAMGRMPLDQDNETTGN